MRIAVGLWISKRVLHKFFLVPCRTSAIAAIADTIWFDTVKHCRPSVDLSSGWKGRPNTSFYSCGFKNIVRFLQLKLCSRMRHLMSSVRPTWETWCVNIHLDSEQKRCDDLKIWQLFYWYISLLIMFLLDFLSFFVFFCFFTCCTVSWSIKYISALKVLSLIFITCNWF